MESKETAGFFLTYLTNVEVSTGNFYIYLTTMYDFQFVLLNRILKDIAFYLPNCLLERQVIAIKKTYRRVANGCSDASGGAWAYMAISRTPVIRTRKRRILLIHPLGMLPTILTSLQINRNKYHIDVVADSHERVVSTGTTVTMSLVPADRLSIPFRISIN